MTEEAVHPIVRAAASGELPAWAQASAKRREHMRRVTDLLGSWSRAFDLPEHDRIRWRAAGWLHDTLRGADAAELRDIVRGPLASLPPPLLHGPAAAERLAEIADPPLLTAIRYHTLGHPSLDRLGRALYLADFLEPGRSFRAEWRARLRERVPEEADQVLVEVVAARIDHLIERRNSVRPETVEFWNSLVGER